MAEKWVELEDGPHKEFVLWFAKKAGCDVDGDTVEWCGTIYYVHLFQGIVRRRED